MFDPAFYNPRSFLEIASRIFAHEYHSAHCVQPHERPKISSIGSLRQSVCCARQARPLLWSITSWGIILSEEGTINVSNMITRKHARYRQPGGHTMARPIWQAFGHRTGSFSFHLQSTRRTRVQTTIRFESERRRSISLRHNAGKIYILKGSDNHLRSSARKNAVFERGIEQVARRPPGLVNNRMRIVILWGSHLVIDRHWQLLWGWRPRCASVECRLGLAVRVQK